MKKYDYVLVGAGLYSGVIAYLAGQAGKNCLVLERRDHTGGNIYCEEIEGIHVHKYGAHIFHTSNKEVWQFVNSLAEFNRYTNSPIANYKGEIYNMPFNMNTFSKMWGIRSELPSFIIKRLPVRFTYDNNYFNDLYQGIPIGGYNVLTERLFEKADVQTGVDFLEDKEKYLAMGETVIYTGAIDAFYDYALGKLEYRTVRFETEVLDTDNYQGVAVVNYTDRETPYTRVIEHKHFEFGTQKKTVISREYSTDWKEGMEPYYPVNDARNQELYQKYAALAEKEEKVIFGGRLGEYKYYDMDKVIEAALNQWEKMQR